MSSGGVGMWGMGDVGRGLAQKCWEFLTPSRQEFNGCVSTERRSTFANELRENMLRASCSVLNVMNHAPRYTLQSFN